MTCWMGKPSLASASWLGDAALLIQEYNQTMTPRPLIDELDNCIVQSVSV